MFEKDLSIGYLLDFYGELLAERRRGALDMYYNEDLSLSEIAEVIGISRQGVRDMIKKAEAELLFYEEKLGLARRFGEVREAVDRISTLASELELPAELRAELEQLAAIV